MLSVIGSYTSILTIQIHPETSKQCDCLKSKKKYLCLPIFLLFVFPEHVQEKDCVLHSTGCVLPLWHRIVHQDFNWLDMHFGWSMIITLKK